MSSAMTSDHYLRAQVAIVNLKLPGLLPMIALIGSAGRYKKRRMYALAASLAPYHGICLCFYGAVEM
jgi:hypothetical protein